MEYQIMPDIREKEKIVGGKFTITQVIFLAVGIVVGGLLGYVTYTATGSIPLALVLILVGAAPFVPFAFIKKEELGDMELFFYLLIKFKYSKSQKVFVNMNENQRKRITEELNNEKAK